MTTTQTIPANAPNASQTGRPPARSVARSPFFLSLLAYVAPAIIPTVSLVIVLEAMSDWHRYIWVAVPLLAALATVVFWRTTSSAIYQRTLAVMNIGMAADLALGVLVQNPDTSPVYDFVPLALLLPIPWCLVMWFRQEYWHSFWSLTHAARKVLVRATATVLTLIPPIMFSSWIYGEMTEGVALGKLDTIQVIQGLSRILPFYHLDDRKFLRHLIKIRYYWYSPERLNQVNSDTSFDSILTVAKDPLDDWSHIQAASHFKAGFSNQRHGFGISKVEPQADGDLTLKVEPGSPAFLAGLRRGDTILSIDGISVANRSELSLLKRSPDRVFPLRVIRDNSRIETLPLIRSAYAVQLVGDPKVLDVRGHKVGYLAYDIFAEEARAPLAAAMRILQGANLSEFVLDLRYNAGGSMVEEGVLAGMLAPREALGRVATKTVSRVKSPLLDVETLISRNQPRPIAAPQRLFVITSEETCSASESLIMGLRSYMTVITIGSTTCGKPFGMNVTQYGDKAYALISFAVTNSRGESDYAAGVPPTCDALDDPHHELGDPREGSLAEALFYIEHGHCSSATNLAQIHPLAR
jgi:carboxyl-terminal processing protease